MRAIFTLLVLANVLAAQQQATPMGVINQTGVFSPSPWFVQAGVPGGVRQQGPLKTDCAADGYVVNGVTGEPIARARVTLMGGRGLSSVVADSSGHWSFSNAACGTVQIMASRPGFLNGNQMQQRMGAAPFRPLVLTSGSPEHDIRIQLAPQAVIVGKVVDDQGDPVMNAQVNALTSRVVEGHRTFQPAGGSNTNDLGDFRIANQTAGKYVVCARANGFGAESSALGESCYPGPIEGGAASTMELPAGRETRVDFTLHEVPTVHVRGTITGLPKNRGAGISLVKRGNGMNGNQGPGGARQARIDADGGSFDIAGVTAGAWLLSTDYYDTGVRLMARVPVDVGSSDLEGVAVHLDSGFKVTGAVRIESKAGNAPPGQQFNFNLRPAEPMGGGGQVIWSQDHSTFTINDLMPGAYRFEAFPPGGFFVKSATLAGRDILGEDVPITQSAGPIDVVLSDDAGILDAQVTGVDDQAVQASWVMVMQNGLRPHMARTGADGHIKMNGLAPGDYRVYAWDDFQQVEYANPEWMQRYGGNGASVSVQAGQTAQVSLKQQNVPAQ
jgi:Carboxypeptidase regulatory-like domain